jgi:thymidylate kinase
MLKLITLSGLDGSGKSTQTEMLRKYLESQDKKVFYFHAIQFGLAQKIKNKLLSFGSHQSPSDPKEKSVTRANWIQIQLRKFFLLIDLKRFRMLKRKLERKGYNYILSDRYFFDTVINLLYLSGKKPKPKELFKYGLKELRPDLAIYIQASPEIIMQRERKPDQGIKYLEKKNELLNEAAPYWKMEIIDGNREKEIVFSEIINSVQENE